MGLSLREQRGRHVANEAPFEIDQFGRWYIYRRSHTDRPASREPLTGEGLEGYERFETTDEAILAAHDSTGITGTRGLITDTSLFYIPAVHEPKRGDVIISVRLPNKPSFAITKNEVLNASHIQAYRITEMDTKTLDSGVVSHYVCVVEPEMGLRK
jgi:hypothetical protein